MFVGLQLMWKSMIWAHRCIMTILNSTQCWWQGFPFILILVFSFFLEMYVFAVSHICMFCQSGIWGDQEAGLRVGLYFDTKCHSEYFVRAASIKTAKSVRAQSNAKFMQIQNLYFFTCDLHRRARLYLAIWHPTRRAGNAACNTTMSSSSSSSS